MKNGIDKLPTTTVTPIRLCVFQATRRPKNIVKSIETAYGKVTIEGRLGQAHADLLDCVMHCKERHRINNGKLEIIVDPQKLRIEMGGGKRYSGEQIEVLENDLLKAILTIDTIKFKVRGHIIEKIIDSNITKLNPTKAAERPLRCWILSEDWTKLVEGDVKKYYDPKQLCKIEHGSVAAVARHVLTHQHQPNGGWVLNRLIEAAGVERQLSKVKKEIFDNKTELAELGIKIENERVFLAVPARFLAAPARF